MREFIDEHFNVLVLVMLLCGSAGIFLHVTHHAQDSTTLNWIEHVSDQVLAALLGMMVGRASNGNGNSTAPPSVIITPKPEAGSVKVS